MKNTADSTPHIPNPKTMKSTMCAARAARGMVALQESAAFLRRNRCALSCGEEVPEDGPEEGDTLLEARPCGSTSLPF